ncbi:MAG: hypothetical protein UY56_C0005G0015 [Parcubacteria group bacterium GW2011_GWA1_50_14]|nr:MAG: hypothetical protein UY56_C0005G0015 [Parcubacteria group bacterium GW2011_GWA1_50_14]
MTTPRQDNLSHEGTVSSLSNILSRRRDSPPSLKLRRARNSRLVYPVRNADEPMGRIELPSMVYETIALPLSYIGISNGAGETATLPLN